MKKTFLVGLMALVLIGIAGFANASTETAKTASTTETQKTVVPVKVAKKYKVFHKQAKAVATPVANLVAKPFNGAADATSVTK